MYWELSQADTKCPFCHWPTHLCCWTSLAKGTTASQHAWQRATETYRNHIEQYCQHPSPTGQARTSFIPATAAGPCYLVQFGVVELRRSVVLCAKFMAQSPTGLSRTTSSLVSQVSSCRFILRFSAICPAQVWTILPASKHNSSLEADAVETGSLGNCAG